MRYMSWTIRPSARIVPFFAKKSLTGIAFMRAITLTASVLPTDLTASR